MLECKQSDTAYTMIVTLTGQVTIPSPYFLFVFININTRDVVSLIINSTADLSLYQYRYNAFLINPSVLFAGYNPGQWLYNVYQQASATNTDTTLTQGLVENGKLNLDRAVDFAYTNYSTPTNYKAYAG